MLKEFKNSNRNVIYDVIKAIGIIAIVLGHCFPYGDVVRFVYGFHLAIFFFVSGLQFNDKKYANEPFLLLQNRVKSMWPSFFCYMTFFTLTFNIATRIHLLPSSDFIGPNDMLSRVINNFFFYGGETLGGAMWFVPMMLAGVIIFSAVLYLSKQFVPRFRIVLTVLITLAIGGVGILAVCRHYHYVFFTEISFLLIPLMLLGYLISLKGFDFKKLLKLPIFIITLAFFVFFTVIKDCQIELSAKQIVSPYLFYPITVCGIYSMCYLAKVLSSVKYVSSVLAFIGRYSFDIMALHFLIFKLVDLVVGLIIKAPALSYSIFPRAYPKLWPIYLVLSIAIAPFVRIAANRLYSAIKNFCAKTFAAKE